MSYSTICGGIILLLCGVVLLLKFILTVREGWASKSWPSTTGTVTHANIKKTVDSDGANYEVSVKYDYVVAGKPYTGDRRGPADTSSSSSSQWAETFAARYRQGHEVKVYYNPDDPQTALLQTGIPLGGSLMFFGGGIAFLAIGIYMILSSYQ